MQVYTHAREMTRGAGRGIIPPESFVEKETKGWEHVREGRRRIGIDG